MKKVTLLFLLPILFLISCSGNSAPTDTVAEQTEQTPPVSPLDPVPIVAANAEQRIYHIDPQQSEARYAVDEILFGTVDGRTVVGSTPQITGELMIDWAQPSNSRLGVVEVELTSLKSDSNLRDQRIRDDYLASNTYPLATFVPDHDGVRFPATLSEGELVSFALPGTLTVRDITQKVQWLVDLTVAADQVNGSAELEIQMSDYELGPISIIGLLETQNEMILSLDFVATVDDVQSVAVVDAVEEMTAVSPVEGAPEYFADIEPILSDSCVACHAAGQLGHGIYPMETARDAVAYADDLAFVTSMRNMPPWPASDNNPEFMHDRRITDAEIELISAWAAAGAPIDGSLDTPLTASQQLFEPIRSDLVLSMPEEYTPSTESVDDFRCFLLDPQLEEDRFLTGYEVVPGNLQVAHHLITEVFNRNDIIDQVALKEAEDDIPGWYCFGNSGIDTDTETPADEARDAFSAMPTWTPGMNPEHFPEGTGLKLTPDSVIVMQMHYNTTSGTGPDQTAIHLELAPPEADLRPITGFDLFAPVEIPCPEDINTTACTREAALEWPTAGGGEADLMLVACDKTVADYAGQPAENVVSDCLYEVNIDGDLVLAYAHMHELGKAFNMELNPDTPEAQTILDIDRWDFDWQGTYRLAEPMRVSVGDKVRVSCTWDNSPEIGHLASTTPFEDSRAQVRSEQTDKMVQWLSGAARVSAHNEINPEDYRYIIWGEGTGDEMCIGSVAFVPDAGFEEVPPGNEIIPPLTLVRMFLMEFFQDPMMRIYTAVATILILGIITGIIVLVRRRSRNKRKLAL